jgi:hypothetical protein
MNVCIIYIVILVGFFTLHACYLLRNTSNIYTQIQVSESLVHGVKDKRVLVEAKGILQAMTLVMNMRVCKHLHTFIANNDMCMHTYT